MPQNLDDPLDSVVLITHTDSSKFGTGFSINSEQGVTLILTCAHVIANMSEVDKILVDDKPAKVLACGKPEEVDLAVLKVQGLDIPLLKLGPASVEHRECRIAGFGELTGKLKRAEQLEGRLGSRAVLKAPGGPRVNAWKLLIEGQAPLESGYSGSPVICDETNKVFAVASHSEYQGERGYAVSLAHLQDIWPVMPSRLLSSQLQTSEWMAREQREFLEDLFQKAPVSIDQLRAWCHEAMPHNVPHVIPEDANALDLLEWLVVRGQLAGRQVPLLSVMQKLLPLIADADLHSVLERCIKQVARHFGISDIQAMTELAPDRTKDFTALMLEIWSNAPPGNWCNVQGRLLYSSKIVHSVYAREEGSLLNLDNDEDLMDLIGDLRGILSEHSVDKDYVIVEFILPRELLSQSVEQWTDEFDDPLGTVFPVVVRPRERLRDRKLQLGWQNCWDTLLSNWEKTFPDSLWWFERSQRRQIRGKLQEGVCIALRFVPDLHAPLQQNAVLYLLHNGVSVALWPRQDEGLTDFADGLQAFLQHKPLKDLPQIIRALRYQLWAEQKESAPCYHLTLLWDDPRRHIPLPVEDDEFLQPPD